MGAAGDGYEPQHMIDTTQIDPADPTRWRHFRGTHLDPSDWRIMWEHEGRWSRKAVIKVILYSTWLVTLIGISMHTIATTSPTDRTPLFWCTQAGFMLVYLTVFGLAFPRRLRGVLRREHLDAAPDAQQQIDALVGLVNEQSTADARDGVGPNQHRIREAYRLAALGQAAFFATALRVQKVREQDDVPERVMQALATLRELLATEGRSTPELPTTRRRP